VRLKEAKIFINQTILVTGVNGFVASWLTKRLVDLGANVVGVLYEENPLSELFNSGYDKKIIIEKGDLKNIAFLEKIFKKYRFNYCFHLAAQTIVQTAREKPWETFENNIRGTYNLLEISRLYGELKGFIFTSSDKAYGEQKKLPYREQQPLEGIFPYDVSKACGERLVLCYYHTYGLPIAISRCGNIYGGGDHNFSRLIPDTIRRLLCNQRPLVRSDGTPIRDYIYVEDVVEALISLATKISETGIQGEAFNFSGEKPYSVLEVVNKILEITNKSKLKPKILGKGTPEGEISKQYLDCKKAKMLLGFKPKTSLEKGLKKTINWYKDFFKKSDFGLPK